MNQQAFYRDTAIGEFQLDANGMLAYRSWGQRRRTLQVQQHRMNQFTSKIISFMRPNATNFIDKYVGMTYEERFGRS